MTEIIDYSETPYSLGLGLLKENAEKAELKKRAWHQYISDRLNQKLLALVYKRRLKEIVR